MGRTYTQEDVIKMMNSVVRVTVHLYPESYATDASLYNMLMPVVEERDALTINNVIQLEESYNTILRCIDDAFGVKNYLNIFSKEFDINDGIETCYEKLTNKYSSLEIILLYGVFKNLSYVNIYVHLDKDIRQTREKDVTVLKLPDLHIDTLSLKLRDYCSQRIVDIINKHIIANSGFDDNVMTKQNVFMSDKVESFLGLIEQICQSTEFNQEFVDFMKEISFLDIDELKNATIMVTTDWPVL